MARIFRGLFNVALIFSMLIFQHGLSLPGLAGTSESLAYVESSTGLIPPEFEGGHTEIEMGDVNRDGNPDLVSIGDHGSPYVNTDQHGIMVWFGDGAGNWSVYQSGEFGYGGVALGDINADGFLDVGYGMHHNYSGVDLGDQLNEVALGDGTGHNWTPWDNGLATNGEEWGMFGTDFADVDNDGDLDLGSNSFGCCAGVHVYLNQGDGTWQQSFGFLGGNSAMQFDFGDVNGDGNPDFAVSHQYGKVYLGDGLGGFTIEQGNLPPIPLDFGVSLGDVNHDGREELGITTNSGGVQVWSWTAPGTWQNLSGSLPASGPYEAVQLYDMNMDGETDVVAFGNGQVRVWAGDGSGNWNESASFTTPSPGYMQSFRVGGDADHNGFPDIVLVTEEGGGFNYQNHLRFFKESSTPTELSIKPVAPAGSARLHAGGVTFIDWVSAVPTETPGLVALELSTHGPAGPWEPIADNLPDNGRFQWLIPAGTPSTSEAYIRYSLTVMGETVESVSRSGFNIMGAQEEPISGLETINNSPSVIGETTILTATVETGTNVLYEWDLGDGTAEVGAVVSHIYPEIGVYTATVTASNSMNSAVAESAVIIYEESISGLVAYNNSPTYLGDTTILTATVETGTNVLYDWDLGDGTAEVGAVVSHIYPDVGNYIATVVATNTINQAQTTSSVDIQPIFIPYRFYIPLLRR